VLRPVDVGAQAGSGDDDSPSGCEREHSAAAQGSGNRVFHGIRHRDVALVRCVLLFRTRSLVMLRLFSVSRNGDEWAPAVRHESFYTRHWDSGTQRICELGTSP